MRVTYCKILDGEVVDQQLFDEGKTPAGEDWRPVFVETPDYDRRTHREVGRGNRVEPGRVVRTRMIEPIPLTQQDYANAIQAHIDATAASKGYGDGYGLASYKDSTVPAWAAEAQAFIAWRDSVWLAAYLLMGEVDQGLKTAPAIDELIAELPKIDWPD